MAGGFGLNHNPDKARWCGLRFPMGKLSPRLLVRLDRECQWLYARVKNQGKSWIVLSEGQYKRRRGSVNIHWGNG
ncbi:hypothetical protein MTBLM1_10480 [Rhodospirillaceae bacterium LM-1]|nr:hypothetical protein MTBLM1_10480 [Rhodospirillaceae bacterium LM-1]